MLRIVVNGALGKMGRMVCEMASLEGGFEVVAGVDRFAAGAVSSFPLFESLSEKLPEADCIVDFSRPEALDDIIACCRRTGMAAVLATTGYQQEHLKKIADASADVALFQSANMSVGINLLLNLSREAAKALRGFDIEIVEAHHNTKVDSPSGTALMLADGINDSLLEKKEYIYGRHTKTQRRDPGEIGIHALRGGTMTGEHCVHFMGPDEFIALRHTSQSRRIYALGALRAAEYVTGRHAGLYNMRDLLLEQQSVTALNIEHGQTLLTLRSLPANAGSVSAIFLALADARVMIDMISQTAPRDGLLDLSFTIRTQELQSAKDALHGQYDVEIRQGLTKLTIEGQGMEHQSGVAARLFVQLANSAVDSVLISTSETKIGLLIEAEQETAAAGAIRTAFSL